VAESLQGSTKIHILNKTTPLNNQTNKQNKEKQISSQRHINNEANE
jgi:hypothetical protein